MRLSKKINQQKSMSSVTENMKRPKKEKSEKNYGIFLSPNLPLSLYINKQAWEIFPNFQQINNLFF